MRIFFGIVLFCSVSISLIAQDHDFIWYLGYSAGDNPTDSLWGRNIIDFDTNDGNPFIYYEGYSHIDFYNTNVTASNAGGDFQFAYNGTYIEDASLEPMENGEEINMYGGELGDAIPQGAVVIPPFNESNQYRLLHKRYCGIPGIGGVGCELYYSTIDMDGNNGLGIVTQKATSILNDTLDAGKLTLTRHANGRDWWLLVPRYDKNEYFTYLINASGINYLGKQEVGEVLQGGLGQASFSPDGQFYALASSRNWSLGKTLDIYNFDRCSGQLSNHKTLNFPAGIGGGTGVAFSPNSRFLYFFETSFIYQYDLYSDDVLASEILIAESDGYLDSIPPNFIIEPTFFLAQLAPDGRIYINSNSSSTILHTIEKPNLKGLNCQIAQHSVQLPSVNRTIPNFPNYRLGALDGSPCDTLGIDNVPVAYFRYDPDSLDYLKFEFTDLSYYEPATWSWDFGDGAESQAINPEYTFLENGIYEVCLTVSNENGEHTFCRTLQLGTTSTEETSEEISGLKIYPNPAKDKIFISTENNFIKKASIYTMTGQLIEKYTLVGNNVLLNIPNLTTGIYLFEIETQEGERYWRKVMVE